MARRIEALEKPKAKEAQDKGRRKGGGDRRSQAARDRSAGNSRQAKRAPTTADTAAAAVGMDRRTYAKHDPAGLHLHKATTIHRLPGGAGAFPVVPGRRGCCPTGRSGRAALPGWRPATGRCAGPRASQRRRARTARQRMALIHESARHRILASQILCVPPTLSTELWSAGQTTKPTVLLTPGASIAHAITRQAHILRAQAPERTATATPCSRRDPPPAPPRFWSSHPSSPCHGTRNDNAVRVPLGVRRNSRAQDAITVSSLSTTFRSVRSG